MIVITLLHLSSSIIKMKFLFFSTMTDYKKLHSLLQTIKLFITGVVEATTRVLIPSTAKNFNSNIIYLKFYIIKTMNNIFIE